MDIEERTNDLLQELLTSNSVSDGIKTKAQEILDDKFKEEVRNKFKYRICDKNYDDGGRKAIKDATMCGFIQHFYEYDNLKDFLDNNYDKMDKIRNTLKEYVKELEEEENKTED